MNKDFKRIAKTTKTFRSKRNKRRALIILWPIICIIFGMIGLPVVWFLGTLIWPFVIIICIANNHSLLKTIVKQMENGEFSDEPVMRQPKQKSQTKNYNASKLDSDPIAKTVSTATVAYVVGKTVNDSVKKSSFLKPSKTGERYIEEQKKYEAQRKEMFEARKPKEEIIRSNGKTYRLITMPNGDQYLVNTRRERVARYSKMDNTTYKGLKKIGKGNLLKTLV